MIVSELGVSTDQQRAEITRALKTNDRNILELSRDEVQLKVDNALLQLESREIITNARYGDYSVALKQYRLVGDVADITEGRYIRWFDGDHPGILNYGGFVVRTDFSPDGPRLLCKNRRGRFFTLYLDDIVAFQRFSNDEWIVLSVFDFIGTDDTSDADEASDSDTMEAPAG